MNTLEQFIAVYEPQGEKNVGFREMLEKVIQEIKNKAQPTNEVIGMRDYFAAKAMQAYVTELTHKEAEYVCGSVAEMAYFMADAMMEARND
jgi:hypothetical protein